MSVSSIPRPVLFLLIGGVLALGAFMLTRKSSGDQSTTPPPPAPASAPAGKSGSSDSKSGGSTESSKSGKAESKSRAPSKSTGSATESADKGLPKDVKQALDQHKVIALLFWRKSSADDRAVYQAVQGLRGRSKAVRVFTAGPEEVNRYVTIVGVEGVNQTPELVIINRQGKADIQTGYVDEKTVENAVFNAL